VAAATLPGRVDVDGARLVTLGDGFVPGGWRGRLVLSRSTPGVTDGEYQLHHSSGPAPQNADYALIHWWQSGADAARRLSVMERFYVVFVKRVLEGSVGNFLSGRKGALVVLAGAVGCGEQLCDLGLVTVLLVGCCQPAGSGRGCGRAPGCRGCGRAPGCRGATANDGFLAVAVTGTWCGWLGLATGWGVVALRGGEGPGRVRGGPAGLAWRPCLLMAGEGRWRCR
jgi:hypothetical protein